MAGVGTPEATQGREAGTPSLVTWWVAGDWILGGTLKKKKQLRKPKFIVTLFTTAKRWKQFKCPSTDDGQTSRGVYTGNGVRP